MVALRGTRRPPFRPRAALLCAAAPTVADAEASPVSEDPDADGSRAPLVLFLGDSLTAGFGLGEESAFPARVGAALADEGIDVSIVNAGVSGDTSAGGLARLGWLLRLEPALVGVGLGANDGLRGRDLRTTESNLREIVAEARGAGGEVLLLGMRMPPNYGTYGEEFAAMYTRLAEELDVALVPFLLEGVGGDPELNLPDGIHPNEEGQRRVAENVLPALRALLEALPSE